MFVIASDESGREQVTSKSASPHSRVIMHISLSLSPAQLYLSLRSG